MPDATILRLLTCRPARPVLFDAALRDRLIQDLADSPGIADVYVGRHGPDDGDGRAIVSVLRTDGGSTGAGSDAETIDARLRAAADDPDACSRVLPVAFAARFGLTEAAHVLRIYRGVVRPGEFDAYVEEARLGTLADGAANSGLVALFLAMEGPSSFVTVSAWQDWLAIETATGGNVRTPAATRHDGHIVSGEVAHYEILRDLTPAPSRTDLGAADSRRPLEALVPTTVRD